MDIRTIATGVNSEALFLTAAWERRVQLWSLDERSLVAEFDTVQDACRVGLCDGGDEPIVIAGAWERHGICGYAADGTRLWQRKDLKRPHGFSPAGDGSLVAAFCEGRPMHLLAAGSGATVATVRAVRDFTQSAFADLGIGAILWFAVCLDTTSWQPRWRVPVGTGFDAGVTSVAGAPSGFVCCGAGGYGTQPPDHELRWRPVSMWSVDLAGEELWRSELPEWTTCSTLAWDAGAEQWVGVWHHVNERGPDRLMRWSPDGDSVAEHSLDSWGEAELLPGGRHVVTSDGKVRETATAEVVWELPTESTNG